MRLGWSLLSSIPGQPQSNGLAEHIVRRVNEGGRACLVQSGLPREWWAYACVFFCFARNVNIVDGDSSYNIRHKTGHCKAQKVPFGHVVGFYQSLTRMTRTLRLTRKRVLVLWLDITNNRVGCGLATTPFGCGLATASSLSSKLFEPTRTSLRPRAACTGRAR